MIISLLATLLLVSCGSSGSTTATLPPQPTDTQEIATEPNATETGQSAMTPGFLASSFSFPSVEVSESGPTLTPFGQKRRGRRPRADAQAKDDHRSGPNLSGAAALVERLAVAHEVAAQLVDLARHPA